ncbi:hypothetical protein Syn7502_00305 [Synechococcus sp. PCC 7502]|uniref:hypothetical protein n=1 Tax=Synechococcus sp. PCC 7502 TaxID=1173263 RepID=UPI00029FF2DA|nr:hypothetical protein [Synechococcus sp. PCC 7502]AFY72472.1 hypothetical protein Syn7502_00305 [Synechococcus sp. PCC 7502]
MNSQFDPPPLQWVLLSTVGGVVTAIALIYGLETLSRSLKTPTIKTFQTPVIQQKSDTKKIQKPSIPKAPPTK